jgi:hypothetical protein
MKITKAMPMLGIYLFLMILPLTIHAQQVQTGLGDSQDKKHDLATAQFDGLIFVARAPKENTTVNLIIFQKGKRVVSLTPQEGGMLVFTDVNTTEKTKLLIDPDTRRLFRLGEEFVAYKRQQLEEPKQLANILREIKLSLQERFRIDTW